MCSIPCFNDYDLLPLKMKRDYLLAKDFSDFIIGAHIRYNVIFSEYKDEDMIINYSNWRNDFLRLELDLESIMGLIMCNVDTANFYKNFHICVLSGDTTAWMI